MKTLLLATTALLAVGASAFAADLPDRKSPPRAYETAIPMFTWTGFYLGLNAGAAFGNNNSNGSYGANGFGLPNSPTAYYGVSGGGKSSAQFIGGGQIGYNYQIGQLVVGAETDLQWVSNGSNNSGYAAAPTVVQLNP